MRIFRRRPDADAPEVLPASRVRFRDLVVHREEGRLPLLGCTDSRRFLEVDETTLATVEELRAGASIEEAEQRILARTGEEYDVHALVLLLQERGFLAEVDGRRVAPPRERGFRSYDVLHRLDPARLEWVHSTPVALLAGYLVTWWVTMLALEPSLVPRWDDLNPLGSGSASTALSVLGLLVFAHAHEAGHFFMARSYGITCSVSLSHRLLLPVLQTDVSNAWVLRPAQRLRIFLAGIAVNLLLAALCGLVLAADAVGYVQLPSLALALLRWAVFLNLFPLPFQLFFFAKTDLYYVLELALKERNLMTDAMDVLRLRLRRLVARLARVQMRPCPEGCGGRVLPEEPFCFRCGATLPVRDPNRFPLQGSARWKLLPFGLLFLAGQLVGYWFVLGIVYRLQSGALFASLVDLRHAIVEDPIDLGRVGDDLFAAALMGLQLVFLGYFVYGMAKEIGLSRVLARMPRWIGAKLRGETAQPAAAPAAIESPRGGPKGTSNDEG